MAIKHCNTCGQDKPADEFHRRRGTPDGRQPRCKACVAARDAGRRRAGHTRPTYDQRQVQARAQGRVRYALRTGRLERPAACQGCGAVGPTDAAHADYRRPLDVRFLCRACHTAWDQRDPKRPERLQRYL